jgi:hypothetical protein
MKPILCSLSLLAVLLACKPSSSTGGPAGHWEGNIALPGMQLLVRVTLENKGAEGWAGTIAIPAQGVRNMNLTGTTVQGGDVSFGMSGIPGDPKFAGKISREGRTISGNFTQGGQTFPFTLERRAQPVADIAPETPDKGVPGKGLAGHWQGSLKPMQGVELRLVLEITNTPQNELQGSKASS